MSRIPIYVSNEKAYVWTVEDVSNLRTNHRICGTLSGTLPHLTQQNFFLGLPLLLMPEEVVLLVENEIAVLVDDNTAFQRPSTEEMLSWDKTRREDFKKQISAWHVREKARQNLNSSNATIKGGGPMSDVALQKRKKREDRRKIASDSPSGNIYSLSKDMDNATSVPSDPLNTKIANYNVHIPATLISLPWYQPSKYENLVAAKEAGVWRYPSTLGEQASCRVFRDLWEKGYFLGSGLKFGGEFLVYPGDPLRYHSHFVASVVESPSASINPMEIVAHGRLGTATKKAHLLCGWDENSQKVTYLSIEWSNFG